MEIDVVCKSFVLVNEADSSGRSTQCTSDCDDPALQSDCSSSECSDDLEDREDQQQLGKELVKSRHVRCTCVWSFIKAMDEVVAIASLPS
eukprot:165558-Amphidinium_carterae.2